MDQSFLFFASSINQKIILSFSVQILFQTGMKRCTQRVLRANVNTTQAADAAFPRLSVYHCMHGTKLRTQAAIVTVFPPRDPHTQFSPLQRKKGSKRIFPGGRNACRLRVSNSQKQRIQTGKIRLQLFIQVGVADRDISPCYHTALHQLYCLPQRVSEGLSSISGNQYEIRS